MEEDERYIIQIPGNIRIRMEVIPGVGIKELIQTIIAGAISAFIAVILNAIFKSYLLAIIFFLAVTSITFLLVMKDKNNNSMADIIVNIYKFYKKQRFYKYVINEEEIETNGTQKI